MASKLKLSEERISVKATEVVHLLVQIFQACGFQSSYAIEIAEHLADSSLCDVESHGVMRVLQYYDQLQSGYLNSKGDVTVNKLQSGAVEVDGGGTIGIPAMRIATSEVCSAAKKQGVAALAICNVGHTGRLGAFAEQAANEGCMLFIVGGGNREKWRQVTPFGGAKAMLGTNPFCMGMPGGKHGPVVLDFATSKIAGGWVYAARSAGAKLPPGTVIDKDGNPTQDPEDYFDGGAILPAAAQKGYAMAVMAEMICEAMLGPVACECNWLMIALDTTRYKQPGRIQAEAETILAELRNCPPAPGFDRVEIPGEREREARNRANGVIQLPASTWQQMQELSGELGV